MIYDVLVIVIVLISLFIGFKRGCAKMLSSLVLSLVAFLISVFLGDYLSNILYDTYIGPEIVRSVSESVSSQTANITTLSDELPAFVRFTVGLTGFDLDSALYNATKNFPLTVGTAFESAIKPVVLSVASFLLTALIFVILYFIFKFIVLKLLTAVFNLPVLRGFNSVLGAVCSLLSSVLLISFIAFLLKLVMPYIAHIPYIFSESTIYNSYIFYYFYSGNIFYTLTSIF